MIRLILKPGRDESVRRRHPWLFSGAVAEARGDGSDGVAEVVDTRGEVLGRGSYSPESQIVARLWTFGERPIDFSLFQSRFAQSRALRERVVAPATTGYRLVNSEGDLCPGVLIDRYGGVAVVELTTGGTESWEPTLVAAAQEVFSPGRLLVRRSGSVHDRGPLPLPPEDLSFEALAKKEGRGDGRLLPLPPGEGRGEGSALADLDLVPFLENGLTFFADVARGQKTGFFLDQRQNRTRLRALSGGKTVLNLFSYSGAFSVAALAGGASRAVDVDSSESALALARRHREANGFAVNEPDFVRADVFEELRRRVEAGETWDLVISDPPAFAKKRSDVERAARGYKDINRLAMKLVARDGLLLTCSCSGLVDASLFQKIVFSAGLEAGRSFSLIARQGAAEDHPVSLDCPEGEYLKGLWLRRVDG
jgi:23S rRNA (cytosine1962-C5)-methyltransferase